MAKRSRRTGARGAASGIRQSLNEAQRAIGGYVRSGSKQVNDAVSTFLSKFDTAHLLDALRKQTMGGARRSTARRRSSTAATRRRTGTSKRRSTATVRRAAAGKKAATRRSVRRK